MIEDPKRTELLRRLERLINQLSLENESNTPDWILARYIVGCVDVFDATVRQRDEWHGFKARITDGIIQPAPRTTHAPTTKEGK